MSKLKFDAIEEFISDLEIVFKKCGLQDENGKSKNKYYFFRGSIPSKHSHDKIVLRYVFTQPISSSADNTWHSLDLYVNATVFINSQEGFKDKEYVSFMQLLEQKCVEHKIVLNYGIDSTEYNIGDISSVTKAKEIEFSKIIKRS